MGLDLGPHEGTETRGHSKERSEAPELSRKAASVRLVSDLPSERHKHGWLHCNPHGSKQVGNDWGKRKDRANCPGEVRM